MSVVVSFAPGLEGEAAVAEAIRQASALGQRLTLVCTLPNADAREQAEGLTDGVVGVSIDQVEDGADAVETILETLERSGGELLVIGLRRRTPVGKLILGSSAQRLLLDAPCPVLAVKPN